jgi:predicted DCC family thiol-disulfide oxidoreductase YuxK
MEKTKVYYDAECKVCEISADFLSGSAVSEKYELINVHTATLPEGFDRTKMLDEIYIQAPDGTVLKNADAILKILEAYWYWRPFIWIARLPGFIHVFRFLYGVLSRNRHKLNSILPK